MSSTYNNVSAEGMEVLRSTLSALVQSGLFSKADAEAEARELLALLYSDADADDEMVAAIVNALLPSASSPKQSVDLRSSLQLTGP
ncbi:hypothetical protein QBK99_21125 [Corticibacterium sp. UT-5YL-CI-8]|nr:hypothetical protein [Tianweitania sp. UT-5YL-CI-8]